MTRHVISRRDFLATTGALAAAPLVACARGSTAPVPGSSIFVGTYTEKGRTDGVFRFGVQPGGLLTAAGAFDAGANPSFIALHPTLPVIYAVNETTTYEGAASGAVVALAIEGATARLLGARRATGGGAPCYISLDRTNRNLLVANYVGGNVAVFRIEADGSIGARTALAQHTGTGPNTQRQEAPHAHCIITDPTNRFAIAADLGTDRLMIYPFDAATGKLGEPRPVATRPGAGPRHLAFHPNGRWLYVANELDLTLTAWRWNADAGTLTPIASDTLVDTPNPAWSAADVHVSPAGRHVYATVRGANQLVVFTIDEVGGPKRVQSVSSGGDWPRNFAISPSGRLILVANQRSNSIVGFGVDWDSGRVIPTNQTTQVPSPVCIKYQ